MNFSDWMEIRDPCYKKVKARYKKWPSAYASGALVQCRKKGAKNWGISEALKNKKEYDDAEYAAMVLDRYKGVDASKASVQDIISALESIGKKPPEGISMELFAARIKSVAREATKPEDFVSEGTFDLEDKKGLHGWFSRNHGKGWIDCKQSTKKKKVPCGRKKAGRGAEREYPACRPTLSACNSNKKKKKSDDTISWKK